MEKERTRKKKKKRSEGTTSWRCSIEKGMRTLISSGVGGAWGEKGRGTMKKLASLDSRGEKEDGLHRVSFSYVQKRGREGRLDNLKEKKKGARGGFNSRILREPQGEETARATRVLSAIRGNKGAVAKGVGRKGSIS